MEYGKRAKEYGAIGTDGRFAIFPDMRTGEDAQRRHLKQEYFQKRTIREAMHKYAPKTENNTEAYVEFLEKSIGRSADTRLKDLTSAEFEKLLSGISRYEGKQLPRTLFIPKDIASYLERVASGKASPRRVKDSPGIIREMSKRAVLSAIKHRSGGGRSGETLKRAGDKVWRIEADGSTRGNFECDD